MSDGGYGSSADHASIGISSVHCQTAAQGIARQLLSAMVIERDNKDKRQDGVLRGFHQFDAPVCVIITYDRVLAGSDDTPFDCGAVATALVNAAWSRGLGAPRSTARASCDHPWCASTQE